jgi:HAMP domain-containing protein
MFRRLLCCWRLLPDTAVILFTFSIDPQRQHLEVIIGGEALKEVALGLHDAVELTTIDLTGAITVSLCDHVLHLLVVDVLSELLSHAGEVAEGDPGGVVVIEQLEDLLDVLAGILLAHLAGHHLEELGELNGAVAIAIDVGEHLPELLVLDLEAEGAHGSLELAELDCARLVGVKQV